MDKYQLRYTEHQKRKKELLTMMAKRESLRDLKCGVDPKFYEELEKVIRLCPSSCDRHGVEIEWVTERKDKELASGHLVGGVGWIHRADRIALLWGRKLAYKSPNEPMMPYLDAGVIIQQCYLFAQCSGVKMCYVNPNVNKPIKETDDVFCGAIAFGLLNNNKCSVCGGPIPDDQFFCDDVCAEAWKDSEPTFGL
jgi:hypothetical protein